DFTIASILGLSPNTEAPPEPPSLHSDDKDTRNSRPEQTNPLQVSSIGPAPSTSTAVESSTYSSTSLNNGFGASSLSQPECGSSRQNPSQDWSMLPSTQPIVSSLLSSTSHVEALSQSRAPSAYSYPSIQAQSFQCAPTTLSSGNGLQISDYPHFWRYMFSSILFNMENRIENTAAVSPTDTASSFTNSWVPQNSTDDVVIDNGLRNSNAGFCAVSSEVNAGEVEEETRPKCKCEECGKTYNSACSLRTHKQCHSRPWKCRSCDKAFSRKCSLQGHERTHTGEKPFVCSTCHHAFADQSNLRAHKQTHMDVKRHRCVHCTKSFGRRSLLVRHHAKCSSSTPTTAAIRNDGFTTSSANAAYDLGTNSSAT
ncbi:Protein escargot, partial [Taenia solium]